MRKLFALFVAVAATATLAFAEQKTVDCGSPVTIKAVPKTHYHFVSWSNSVTTPQQTVTVSEAMSLTATFAKDPSYTLTLNTSGLGNGSVAVIEGAAEEYFQNDVVKIKATPADDCQEFLYWEDDHSNTIATREITFGTSNLSYTAVFGVKQLNITIQSADDEMGTVQFVME